MSVQGTCSSPQIDELKSILENIQRPEALNEHPWTKMQFVLERRARDPAIAPSEPGAQLLGAIADVFVEMMPSMPPRRGLRLDTRWGEFGLLAARYFAPIRFGTLFPPSLRDAWGRIDQAILLFVGGQSNRPAAASDVGRYQLVENEPDVAPDSTLSDWHRKGLQRLVLMIDQRETRLRSPALSGRRPAGKMSLTNAGSRTLKRILVTSAVALALLALVLGGLKAYHVYMLAESVREDLRNLETVLQSSRDRESLVQLAKQLPKVDEHLTALQVEVKPVLWMSPMLSWIPVYGGDIAQAGSLLDLAHHLTVSAERAEVGLSPLLDATSASDAGLSLTDAVGLLSKARPQLAEAQAEFQAAQEVRALIQPDRLSTTVHELLIKKIDPGMGLMDDGLTLALALPSVLGAGSDGPQTYLLLAQNEDELRPTGGFITAVGKLVVNQGHVMDLSFENSGDLDNWSMPYPMAPWQLSQYMNSRVLILRDTNWFPDFPTAALYVKQLYAYTHQNSVDGVIAFDQQLLVMLLKTLGPMQVEGVSYPITADNVTEYMRNAKTVAAGQPVPPGWTYKAFVGTLAEAALDKILSADPPEWRPLSAVLVQALQQRHLLIQMDDRDLGPILARREWDGALSSNGGDFLMVLDSNVGFNKTNAVVDTTLSYDVDLGDPAALSSQLLVSHSNHASSDIPCSQWGANGEITGEESYPIDRCYWDYMRIYAPQGTYLLDARPQAIPDAWMILRQHLPPRVDTLDEGLQGLASFGTLLVVPGGASVHTSLSFRLPTALVLTNKPDGSSVYELTVRKQPGTAAVPITVRIHLPTGSVLQSPSPDWIVDGRNILIQTNLKVELQVEVIFRRH